MYAKLCAGRYFRKANVPKIAKRTELNIWPQKDAEFYATESPQRIRLTQDSCRSNHKKIALASTWPFHKIRNMNARAMPVWSTAFFPAEAVIKEVNESPLVAHSLGLRHSLHFHDQKFVFLHNKEATNCFIGWSVKERPRGWIKYSRGEKWSSTRFRMQYWWHCGSTVSLWHLPSSSILHGSFMGQKPPLVP